MQVRRQLAIKSEIMSQDAQPYVYELARFIVACDYYMNQCLRPEDFFNEVIKIKHNDARTMMESLSDVNPEIWRRFLAKRSKVYESYVNPLHWAVICGRYQHAAVMLIKGAAFNALTDEASIQDHLANKISSWTTVAVSAGFSLLFGNAQYNWPYRDSIFHIAARETHEANSDGFKLLLQLLYLFHNNPESVLSIQNDLGQTCFALNDGVLERRAYSGPVFERIMREVEGYKNYLTEMFRVNHRRDAVGFDYAVDQVCVAIDNGDLPRLIKNLLTIKFSKIMLTTGEKARIYSALGENIERLQAEFQEEYQIRILFFEAIIRTGALNAASLSDEIERLLTEAFEYPEKQYQVPVLLKFCRLDCSIALRPTRENIWLASRCCAEGVRMNTLLAHLQSELERGLELGCRRALNLLRRHDDMQIAPETFSLKNSLPFSKICIKFLIQLLNNHSGHINQDLQSEREESSLVQLYQYLIKETLLVLPIEDLSEVVANSIENQHYIIASQLLVSNIISVALFSQLSSSEQCKTQLKLLFNKVNCKLQVFDRLHGNVIEPFKLLNRHFLDRLVLNVNGEINFTIRLAQQTIDQLILMRLNPQPADGIFGGFAARVNQLIQECANDFINSANVNNRDLNIDIEDIVDYGFNCVVHERAAVF